MKNLMIMIPIILLIESFQIYGQNNDKYLFFYYNNSKYLDAGFQTNRLEKGNGINVEFGSKWWSLGVTHVRMKNIVFNSEINAGYTSFYIDFLYHFLSDFFQPYCGLGGGMKLVFLEKSEGYDYMYDLAFDFGFDLNFKSIIIRTKLKPCATFSNSLQQKYGFEMCVGLGIRL